MSILGTATSGLLAFQRALATTSHNIANSTTQGYSRQRVELSAQNPQMLGGNYIGQGVQVSAVRRLQSDLVDTQLRSSLSNSSYGEMRADYAERIDTLLADDSTGLEPSLESFFQSIQDVASDPTSMSARTVTLNEAETLVERFASIDTQLDEQRTLVNGQIKTTVDEINQYSQSLADLNRQIVAGSTSGSPPNDLLDQRDSILNQLAEKIDVNITKQDDGAVNVFIGNGQALVMAGVSNQLVADHLSGDPENLDIGLKTTSGEAVDISRFMTGGEVGALLETRTGILDTAQNQLGLIGLNLATLANRQNHLGLDLNGNLGGDIFDLPDVVVNPQTDNVASGSPDVTLSDVTQLTPSDYRLRFDGTNFQLTRLPGNQSVTLVPDATDPAVLVGDGMRIDTNSLSGTAAGDSWLIQPTRFAASHLGVAMTDPEDLAAAGAVSAKVSDLNTGKATIDSARAVDASDPTALFTAAIVSYDGTNYTVAPDVGAAAATVSTDLKTNITTITANGWELKIKGTPAAGDQFTVGKNAGYEGDNRNMQAITDLQDLRAIGGKATFQGSYTSIVADVGTQTRQAQIARDSSATLLESAQGQREAISGVNLDEEAANMIRYQQAYQAAAQVIAVTSTIFDTLLNAVQR
jgi:flagellar hook-associated protein 1